MLRLALRRPDAVEALVLAGAAGLSSGTSGGAELLSVFSALRPGRLADREVVARIVRSSVLRRIVFGVVSVADPIALSAEAVEASLPRSCYTAISPASSTGSARTIHGLSSGPSRCPVLVLWGRRTYSFRSTTPSSTRGGSARSCGSSPWSPADRRAARRLRPGDRSSCDGGFERHNLRSYAACGAARNSTRLATTSTVLRFWPASSHERYRSRPSIATRRPFAR